MLPDTVQLSDSQLNSIKTAAVTERDFPTQKEAVGNIDFNDDMNVQVFTPYQGRIIRTYAELGDDVKKGQILFTIESQTVNVLRVRHAAQDRLAPDDV